jgi:hypothetical protein
MSRTRMLWALFLLTCGCGSGQNEANRRGVGAECAMTSDCSEAGQVCLTQFKGGYCGVSSCTHDTSCPQGSACVTDDQQTNYCFLVCNTKTDCNLHRSAADESDCTSSLTFIDGAMNRKVCRPPNSGTATTDGGGAG